MGSRSIKQGHISRSAAVYTPVAVLLVLFIGVFGTSVFLKITGIEVTGALKYSEDDIIKASGVSKGDNLLLVDINAAVIKIRTAMPYIGDIKITPVFPGTLKIEIRENNAVAVINTSGAAWIISSDGMILERIPSARNGLILVRGLVPVEPAVGEPITVETSSETRLTSMKTVLSSFEAAGMLKDISQLDVSNIAGITFDYKGRFSVILGNADGISYKLDMMLMFIETKLPDSATVAGTFDLSGGELSYIPNDT